MKFSKYQFDDKLTLSNSRQFNYHVDGAIRSLDLLNPPGLSSQLLLVASAGRKCIKIFPINPTNDERIHRGGDPLLQDIDPISIPLSRLGCSCARWDTDSGCMFFTASPSDRLFRFL
eukprot:GHVL01039099.1.p2 GENE.GHVL01039099.1~~GHVL01039099.1.p2  ORF type:complete len:117 (+),score=14.32 GHVL01039099.1:37-387(+)